MYCCLKHASVHAAFLTTLPINNYLSPCSAIYLVPVCCRWEAKEPRKLEAWPGVDSEMRTFSSQTACCGNHTHTYTPELVLTEATQIKLQVNIIA